MDASLPLVAQTASTACTWEDDCPSILCAFYNFFCLAPQYSGKKSVTMLQCALPRNENNSSKIEHFAAFFVPPSMPFQNYHLGEVRANTEGLCIFITYASFRLLEDTTNRVPRRCKLQMTRPRSDRMLIYVMWHYQLFLVSKRYKRRNINVTFLH